MKNTLFILLLTCSSSAMAVPHMLCKIYKPCQAKQMKTLEYCAYNIDLSKVGKRKFKAVVTISIDGKHFHKMALHELENNGFTTDVSNGTYKFKTGWNGNKHNLILYSNDGSNFGGNFTLEKKSRFRVACHWDV